MKTIFNIFKRQTAADTAREQLFEAERLHLEHQAAGELHSGLAAIYKMRADRLRATTEAQRLSFPALSQVKA